MIRSLALIASISLFFLACTVEKPSGERPGIIPIPQKMEWKKGSFRISSSTEIVLNSDDPQALLVAEGFSKRLLPFTGKDLSITRESGKPGKNSLIMELEPTLAWELGNEGYRLTVTSSGIRISAARPAGLFYGVQTIYQLLPPDVFARNLKPGSREMALKLPCVEITDKPSFSWRGMHLDVSRHFFPREFVKKYIDLIAMHKMNVFHWHLTDDNGWRIQIDRYPLLTEVAAWRADRTGIPWTERLPQQPGEEATYGGFYSKQDIREIVQYAADRFITVIPEIEMPGHTSEVFAAYPEYSCSGERTTVQTGSYWPNDHIFCAGKDETFTFLENILDEVLELFPSPYIHIGGDEADKAAWKSCRACQSRIKKEGLKDEYELQSYFIKRIQEYLASNERNLVGWDEILEGGLAPGAAVMSWRGYEGGIAAARMGHPVIMCPTSHCYFDYYQADPDFQPQAIGGFTTLQKVYSFRPVPSELTPDEAKLVMGAQGNLWTEYIPTPSHAEYMALPRMTALAEVLWSPQDKLDWHDFRERVQTQLSRFRQMKASYALGSARVEVTPEFDPEEGRYLVTLETEVKDVDIYYTLDGRNPGTFSFPYKNPVVISNSATLKAIAYKDGKPFEKASATKIEIHRGINADLTYNESFSERYPARGEKSLVDGLKGSTGFDDGRWQGFHGKNLDVKIKVDKQYPVSHLSISFLHDQRKWIFLPEYVNFYFSDDGVNFQKIKKSTHDVALDDQFVTINDFSIRLNPPISINFLRIEAVNIGVCPDWHPGKGGKAWIFADEIVIN